MSDEGVRLDRAMVERCLAESRTAAQRLIAEGGVRVDGLPAAKPSLRVASGQEIELTLKLRYVSRGGDKLAGALEDFSLSPQGLVVLDVGASTGGFTDCLLQHGAARVVAVDVGHGQLAKRLVGDARVVSIEGRHARDIALEDIGGAVDAAVADVSFISLTHILPAIHSVLRLGGWCCALVKPQFECGPQALDKHGIVRDEAARTAALDRVIARAGEIGLSLTGTTPSRLAGGDGNRETFVLLYKNSAKTPCQNPPFSVS